MVKNCFRSGSFKQEVRSPKSEDGRDAIIDFRIGLRAKKTIVRLNSYTLLPRNWQ